MEIQTHSPTVEGVRKTLFGLLARGLPRRGRRAPFPTSSFIAISSEYGVKAGGSRTAPPPEVPFMQDAYAPVHPRRHVAVHDLLPLRAHLRRGAGPVRVEGLEPRRRPRASCPKRGETMLDGGCVSCGACVDTCPTGALEDLTVLARGVPTEWTKTICSYCGTGCEVNVGTRRRPDHDDPPDRTARATTATPASRAATPSTSSTPTTASPRR